MMSPDKGRHTFRFRLTLIYGTIVLVSGLALSIATYIMVDQSVTSHGSARVSVVTLGAETAGPNPFGTATPLPGGQPTAVETSPLAVDPTGIPTAPPTDIIGERVTPPKALVDELDRRVAGLVNAERDRVMKRLVISSGVALGGMLVVSVLAGWIVSGRILRPLRRLTGQMKDITHEDLHRRLNASGPNDEIRELSDTFDSLLDRLERSFEAQRRFVANASHELRTPLARQRVVGQVALADPEPTVAGLAEAHTKILESGAEQARILDALLALARGQQRPEDLSDVDLATVVTSVLASRSPGTVTLRTSLDSAVVRANADLVRRLVVNLVDNATRYNRPDGSIDIVTTIHSGRPQLIVTNTGEPIEADQVDGLVEPFRRLGADRIHHGDCVGLGLSIVAAIAESHDADLDLRPGPDGGLAITVTFPSPPTQPVHN